MFIFKRLFVKCQRTFKNFNVRIDCNYIKTCLKSSSSPTFTFNTNKVEILIHLETHLPAMNQFKFPVLYFACLLVFASCDKNVSDKSMMPVNASDKTVLSVQDINSQIENVISKTGSFEWKNASLQIVWSALQQQTDRMVSVGYQPLNAENVDNTLASINLQSADWKGAKNEVLQIIFNEEKKLNPSLRIENLEVWKENKLPVLNVEIKNLETLRLLRESKLVRYVEPMGYDPLAFEDAQAQKNSLTGTAGSGCGGYDGDASLSEGTNYTTIAPNTKMSWNFGYHNIAKAWAKSTGAGVKVMVIDTGVSPDQDNLGSNFNQGESVNRTIETMVTIPNQRSVNDGCGHGTTMSGALAAPRGTDGNSCGVAYNCDLLICRAAQDVYIDQSAEVKGVSNAYTYGADDPSVKIISMSLGRATGNSQIKDAINYAYGKGKLMFCAGGTSYSWDANLVGVIFPANLPQVQAITGVNDKSTLTACEDCHKGKQISYVVVMEQSATGIHPISTAITGDVPTSVGGSSVATATAAGIAALVWSRYPTFTREEVLNRLTVTSSLYPNKSKNFGWGKLDADAATN